MTFIVPSGLKARCRLQLTKVFS